MDGIAARRLMDQLGHVSDSFRTLALAAGLSADVRGVKRAVEVNTYAAGPLIEGYLDVEFRDGTAKSWLLDIGWNDSGWTIDARLALSSSEGQHTVKEVAAESALCFEALLESLDRVVRDLLASGIDDPAWQSGKREERSG